MSHIHDQYDFVISAYIVFKGKVLLVHHPRYNMWLPMGGHIELDEDPEEALFREIKEETGLEVEIMGEKPTTQSASTKPIPAPRYMDVHEANPPHRHINLVYFAKAKNNNHVLSDEHLEINWVGLKDIDSQKYNLSELIKFYVREAIKAVS